ncbi:hypothetical protein OfM1_11260 [Lactovum odontotermitis]
MIQLSANLFFGAGIASCILIPAKNKPDTDTFFLDASREFRKEADNNGLLDVSIDNILSRFDKKEESDCFEKSVKSLWIALFKERNWSENEKER